jgi:hypothetical protein
VSPGRRAIRRPGPKAEGGIDVLRPEYQAWLDRVDATYQAVGYTCGHRLHDRELGDRVSAAVVAGLVTRPGVFRYQGLPFSGRIATLAEARLAEAAAGRLPPGPAWSRLRAALTQVSPDAQDVFVLSCVHGHPTEQIAEALGCGPEDASLRCADVLRLMREIGQSGVCQSTGAGG